MREARIELQSEPTELPVPTLSRTSLFAEKLLCNVDRGLDCSTAAKDIIDLLAMEHAWGFDREAQAIAENAYRFGVMQSYRKAIQTLKDQPEFLEQCFRQVNVSPGYAAILRQRIAKYAPSGGEIPKPGCA